MCFWIIKEVSINQRWSLRDVVERCSYWHKIWVHALERNLRRLKLGESRLWLCLVVGLNLTPTDKNWLLSGCVLMPCIIWDKIRQVWRLLSNRPWLLVLTVLEILGTLIDYSCHWSRKVGMLRLNIQVASKVHSIAFTDVDITRSQLIW